MPTRIASSHNEIQYGESASSRTLAYGGALTPGSLLVVVVVTADAADLTVTVSDSVNGSYLQAGAYATSGVGRVSQWYVPNNASAGIPTVTVSPSALAFVSITLDEYTGAATTNPVRATNTNSGTGTSGTTGSVGASVGDVVVAAMDILSTENSSSAVAPFTLLTSLPGGAAVEGIHTAVHESAGGAEAGQILFTGSSDYVALGVAYKAASGAVDGAVTFCFPDEVGRRRQFHPSRLSASTGNIRPIAPATTLPLAWQPRFPDLVIRRVSGRQPQASPFQMALAPTVPVTPALAWRPTYADRPTSRRPSLSAPWQLASAGQFRSAFPFPDLAWKAVYPDQHLRPRRSVLTTGEEIWSGALRFSPFRAWAPIFPDQVWRTTLPAAARPFFVEVTPSTFPIADVRWRPAYPDRIPPRPRSVLTVGDPTYTQAVLIFQAFRAWKATYPDAVRRTTLPTAAPPFLSELTPSPFPLPVPLVWQGRYADRVDPHPSLRTALQPTWTYATFNFIKNPPPTIDWAAKYPETVRGRVSLRTGGQLVSVENLSPIVNPPAPDQSWQQTFTLPPRAIPLRAGTQIPLVVPLSAPALLVRLEWLPELPTAPARAAAQPPLPTFPFAVLGELAKLDGWTPSYPSHFRLPAWRPSAPVQTWFPVPPALTNRPECIEFTEETFRLHTVAEETFTFHTLSEETLGTFTLAEEDLC